MNGKLWTDEEVSRLRELRASGLSYGQLQEYFPDRTVNAIKLQLAKKQSDKTRAPNLIGQTFGRWHVVGEAPHIPYQKKMWDCVCDCQMDKPEEEREHHYVSTADLRCGKSKSCGCFKNEFLKSGTAVKRYNRYEERDGYMVGYTANGYEFYFDKEDYDKIKDFSWAEQNGYLFSFGRTDENGNRQYYRMHRLIMGVGEYDRGNNEVDHINGIRSDNRKCNLRIVSHSDNMKNVGISARNTSGYKGVGFNKYNGTWTAYIKINKKWTTLGTYSTYEEALSVRKEAEKEYYGEFARAPEYFLNQNGKINNPII